MPIRRPHSVRLVLVLGAVVLACLCGAAAAPSIETDGLEGANAGAWEVSADGVLRFSPRSDTHAPGEWRWYHFRLNGAQGVETTLEIPNARKSSASAAWPFNRPVVSSDDGRTWRRVSDTRYADGAFRFTFVPGSDRELVAMVYPYEFARHLRLMEEIADDPAVAKIDVLAQTIEGRPLHRVVIRSPRASGELPVLWVIARQHPGESPGSWKAEALVRWLLSDDPGARELIAAVEFHVVPFMNPDGVVAGNYRRNATGRNLNREWENPDPATEPTVHAVQRAMREHRDAGRTLLAFFDLHAFSTLRKNFCYYNEDPDLDLDHFEACESFLRNFESINPDFSYSGSDASSPEVGNIAKNWVHLEFRIPAYTFESSYQDVAYGPNAGEPMTIERYQALGRDLGRAIRRTYLRDGQLVRPALWDEPAVSQ